MTRYLFGPLLVASVFAASAVLLNAPLMLALRLARRRLPPVVPKVLLGSGFAAAAGYVLWTTEWFDVWRHGTPPIAYLLKAYLPWVGALAVAGWFAGGLLVRAPRAHRP